MPNSLDTSRTTFYEAYVEVGATTASMTALGETANTYIETEIRDTEFYSPHIKAIFDWGDIERIHRFGFTFKEMSLYFMTVLLYGYPVTNLSPASPNATTLNLNAADQKNKAVRITGKDTADNDLTVVYNKCRVRGTRRLDMTIEREGVHAVDTTWQGAADDTGDFGDLTQGLAETEPTGWTGI